MVGGSVGYFILGYRVSSERIKKDRTNNLCSTSTCNLFYLTKQSKTYDTLIELDNKIQV